jgi:predicted nucleic acid-binding protein
VSDAVFADTFFFIALLSPSDEAHTRAEAFIAELARPLVTTTWVLMEVGDGFCGVQTRAAFLKLVAFLESHPLVDIVMAEEAHYRAALEMYRQRPDKQSSLTDCTSFHIMSQLGIRDALTGDHHFEQAGFIALLRPNEG